MRLFVVCDIGVAVVLGTVNAYLTTATTEKKGFASKQENRIEGD